MKELQDILSRLKKLQNPENIAGMQRFGIFFEKAYGVPTPVLRDIAKSYKNNTPLAMELWNENYLETRILATLIADKKQFTEAQMDDWTQEFDSWGVCDAACFNIFRHLPWAYDKIFEYAVSDKEFVRRTAFSLLAGLAVNDKKKEDKAFLPYLQLIVEYSTDERNFVRKAVNWALRQVGKRSQMLHKEALNLAEQLKKDEHKTARWIGSDAYRELTNPKIMARIKPSNASKKLKA